MHLLHLFDISFLISFHLFLLQLKTTHAAPDTPVRIKQSNVILMIDTDAKAAMSTVVKNFVSAFRAEAAFQTNKNIRLFSFNPDNWNGVPMDERTFRRQDYGPLVTQAELVFNSPKSINDDLIRVAESFPTNRKDPKTGISDPPHFFVIVSGTPVTPKQTTRITAANKQNGKTIIFETYKATIATTIVGKSDNDVVQCRAETHAECHMTGQYKCGSTVFKWWGSVRPHICAQANDVPTESYEPGNCGNPNDCGCNTQCCFTWAAWSTLPCSNNQQVQGNPIPLNASQTGCDAEMAEFAKTKPNPHPATCSKLRKPAEDLARPTKKQVDIALGMLKKVDEFGKDAADNTGVAVVMMILTTLLMLIVSILSCIGLCLYCKYGKKCNCDERSSPRQKEAFKTTTSKAVAPPTTEPEEKQENEFVVTEKVTDTAKSSKDVKTKAEDEAGGEEGDSNSSKLTSKSTKTKSKMTKSMKERQVSFAKDAEGEEPVEPKNDGMESMDPGSEF